MAGAKGHCPVPLPVEVTGGGRGQAVPGKHGVMLPSCLGVFQMGRGMWGGCPDVGMTLQTWG